MRTLLLVFSAVLLVIAFFVSVGWIHSNWEAWATAGLVLFVVSFIEDLPRRPR